MIFEDDLQAIGHLQNHLQDLIGHLQDISDTNSEFLEDDDLEDDGYLIGHLQSFMIIFKIYRASSRNFYTSGRTPEEIVQVGKIVLPQCHKYIWKLIQTSATHRFLIMIYSCVPFVNN